MSFRFYPFGIYTTCSFAVSSSIAAKTNTYPVTASIADYSITSVGPQGPAYKTVSSSKVTIV